MSGRVITLGEVMLRLKTRGHERFLQSPVFEATFGGGEANVAVSAACFGLDVAFVTILLYSCGDLTLTRVGAALLRVQSVSAWQSYRLNTVPTPSS